MQVTKMPKNNNCYNVPPLLVVYYVLWNPALEKFIDMDVMLLVKREEAT